MTVVADFEDGMPGRVCSFPYPGKTVAPWGKLVTSDSGPLAVYEEGRGGTIVRLQADDLAGCQVAFWSWDGEPVAGIGGSIKPMSGPSQLSLYGETVYIEFFFCPTSEPVIGDSRGNLGIYVFGDGPTFQEHLHVDWDQWFTARLTSSGFWELTGTRIGLIASGTTAVKQEQGFEVNITGKHFSDPSISNGSCLADDLFVYPAIQGSPDTLRREFM